MNGFDDLVSTERRRLEAQAAAERAKSAKEQSRNDAWEREELREWHAAIERIQELFAAAVKRLQQEGVRPLPVLEHRPPPPRPAGWDAVDRTVITGYRWQFEVFALDKQCRAYKATAARPLMAADSRSQWSIRKRLANYVLRGKGLGATQRLAMLRDKSLLRTGLQPTDLILWGEAADRIELDPAAAVRAGRVHCFGKAEDGTPLLLKTDGRPEPLETFIARQTGRVLAQR
jgi:hypothetical protein